MPLTDFLKQAARRTPPLARLLAQRDQMLRERIALIDERDRLRLEIERRDRLPGFVPPGHFYSPIPAWNELQHEAPRLFPDPPPRTLPGIELREAEQLALLHQLTPLYAEMPFTPEAQPGLRYRFDNGAFSYADAIFLHLMLRHLRPARVVEVGSGHSSCVTLDTNERFLANSAKLTFIEPYPDLLHSLLQPGDEQRITILPTRLQDIPLTLFEQLDANDVLFIDSTHVAKIGSDVRYIFDAILPALRPGVAVHFHDIFYPFEYPRYWFDQGRAWNEAYLLRCFLQYNATYRVELWNNFLLRFNEPFFTAHMPLCLQNPGASLWLRRLP